jgi:hypothetical protein
MWREDDWFQSLEPDARLFWVYLLTNPSASVAGIYRLTERTMVFECGIDAARVRELKQQFTKADKAYFEGDVIWVRKMREYQSAENPSQKVVIRMNKDVAAIPDCDLKIRYMKAYGYGINRVSIPRLTDTDTYTDTDTETHTETEQEQTQNVSPAWTAFVAARGVNINPLDSETLADWETLYGSEAVAQAIHYCNENKKQAFLSLKYILSVLNGWQGDGTLGLHPFTNGNGNSKLPPASETAYRYVEQPDGKMRRVPVTA